MLEKLRKMNFRLVNWLEFLVSIIIIISIVIEGTFLAGAIFKLPYSPDESAYFSDFLGNALNLVIALEFLKMLNSHDPNQVIDVLIFTIARSLVVKHPDSFGILLGVLSIAILFAVRKFLIEKWKQEQRKE